MAVQLGFQGTLVESTKAICLTIMPSLKRKTISSYIPQETVITQPLLTFLVGLHLDDDSLISFLLTSKTINQTITQKFAQRISHIKQNQKSYPVPEGSFTRRGFVVNAAPSLIKSKNENDNTASLELCTNQPPIPDCENIIECYFHDAHGFAVTEPNDRGADRHWTLYCWDTKSSAVLWTRYYEYKPLQTDYITHGTQKLFSFFIDVDDNSLWISRIESRNSFAISQHNTQTCEVIKSKSFPRRGWTKFHAAPTLALYDKFVLFIDNRNGKLVVLDRNTLDTVQDVSPLPEKEVTRHKRTSVKLYTIPRVREDLPPDWRYGADKNQYSSSEVCEDQNKDKEGEKENQEDKEENNEEEELEEEEEEAEESQDDEKEHQGEPMDYGTLKHEMGLTCVSSVLNPDGSKTLRIVWAWNAQIQLAVFHHNNNTLQLEKQITHKIHFYTGWGEGYKDMMEGFCESFVKLCIHENDLIIAVDTHGEKSATSFVHIVDLHTGKFLWRLEDDLAWFVSSPCVFDHVLYLVYSGDILALNLKDRRFKTLWCGHWLYEPDDDHYPEPAIAVSRSSENPALFIYAPAYDLEPKIFCVNRLNGKLYWEYVCGNDGVPTGQFVQGEVMYVLPEKGGKPIVALQPTKMNTN